MPLFAGRPTFFLAAWFPCGSINVNSRWFLDQFKCKLCNCFLHASASSIESLWPLFQLNVTRIVVQFRFFFRNFVLSWVAASKLRAPLQHIVCNILSRAWIHVSISWAFFEPLRVFCVMFIVYICRCPEPPAAYQLLYVTHVSISFIVSCGIPSAAMQSKFTLSLGSFKIIPQAKLDMLGTDWMFAPMCDYCCSFQGCSWKLSISIQVTQ